MNEKLYTIHLPEHDLNNLKVFLSRVNLTGKEVPAFNQLIKSIYEAKPEENIKAGE